MKTTAFIVAAGLSCMGACMPVLAQSGINSPGTSPVQAKTGAGQIRSNGSSAGSGTDKAKSRSAGQAADMLNSGAPSGGTGGSTGQGGGNAGQGNDGNGGGTKPK